MKNPYNKGPPSPPQPKNPFTIARGVSKPNTNRATNSSNSGKAGRPPGSENKAGHKAGGNRKDAGHVTITSDQRSIKPYGIIIKPTFEMGASDASKSSDDPDSDSESECQQMMKLAEQALWDYAKSFPNGALDVEMDQEDNSTDSSIVIYLLMGLLLRRTWIPYSIKWKITKGLPSIELQRGQAWIPPVRSQMSVCVNQQNLPRS